MLKLKNDEFNHLIFIIILPLMYGLELPFKSEAQCSPMVSSISYGSRLIKWKSLVRISFPPSLIWTCKKKK